MTTTFDVFSQNEIFFPLPFRNVGCGYPILGEKIQLSRLGKKVNHEMFMVKLYQNTNVKSVKSEISYW
jgi:hypothetical protein